MQECRVLNEATAGAPGLESFVLDVMERGRVLHLHWSAGVLCPGCESLKCAVA